MLPTLCCAENVNALKSHTTTGEVNRLGETVFQHPSLSSTKGEPDQSSLRSPFRYYPLDQSAREIRVIQVLPRDFETDLISCKVKYISLDSIPNNSDNCTDPKAIRVPYKALSYTWGQEAASKEILLDGATFYVRPNLFTFLEMLCSAESDQWHQREGYLWIDAICIDQQNAEERNHQVRQMGNIYSKAQQVIVWLSDAKQILASGSVLTHRRKLEKDERQKIGLFEAVCRSHYWTRLWTVQEVILATDIMMVFGDKVVDFDILIDKKRMSCPATSLYMWRYLNGSATRQAGLIDAIQTYSNRHCKEVKDRLFALLAIVANGDDFPVDYRDTTDIVFWKALHLFGGSTYSDDAIAVGICLYGLLKLTHIINAPDNLIALSSRRVQSMQNSPSLAFAHQCMVPVTTGTVVDATQMTRVFPIRLNLLETNASKYFACFNHIRLCACGDCESLQVLQPSFNSAQQDSSWHNYFVFRHVSILHAVSIFERDKHTHDHNHWLWVAVGLIQEYNNGTQMSGTKQSLTLYPPPGGKPFWCRGTGWLRDQPDAVLVDAIMLRDLLQYRIHFGHNRPAWRGFCSQKVAKSSHVQFEFGCEKDNGRDE